MLGSNRICVLVISVSLSDSDVSVDTSNSNFEEVVAKLGRNSNKHTLNTGNTSTPYVHRHMRVYMEFTTSFGVYQLQCFFFSRDIG